MKVAVVGATGNVGTSVLRALGSSPAVEAIVALARREPRGSCEKTTFHAADVTHTPLEPLFRGVDAVVHLAWRIQSAHDPRLLERTNVYGSQRVFEAAASAGVKAVLYNSSVGAYAPGPKDQRVNEDWPTSGIATSLYSRQKAQVERLLDSFEEQHRAIRVVRFRPALIFKRDAATEIRRYFAAPWIPRVIFSRRLLKAVPYHPRLCFQAVHSWDVGDAFRRALLSEARGAFNLAADPILNSPVLAQHLGARQVRVSTRVLRTLLLTSWKLRLQHTDPGWLDLCFDSPLMDATRAQTELGWQPHYSALEALDELLDGARAGAGIRTPPLAPPWKIFSSTRARAPHSP